MTATNILTESRITPNRDTLNRLDAISRKVPKIKLVFETELEVADPVDTAEEYYAAFGCGFDSEEA